jgi:hypothetical protein
MLLWERLPALALVLVLVLVLLRLTLPFFLALVLFQLILKLPEVLLVHIYFHPLMKPTDFCQFSICGTTISLWNICAAMKPTFRFELVFVQHRMKHILIE